MDIKNIFKKEYVVGLDIGSASAKAAVFTRTKDGLRLVKAEIKEFSKKCGEGAPEKEVIAGLRYLLRGADLPKSRVVVSVNCGCTAIKKVVTPYMPKSELRNGLKIQAVNYFPFPIDKSIVDFEIAGDTVEKGVRKCELVIGVSPCSTVDKYIDILKKAGIKPASFIPASYAMRKIAGLLSKTDKETACYIDIGESSTELIICKEGRLLFCRKIPVSSLDFTKALTRTLVSDKGKTQLSLEEAEKIKKDIGFPSEKDTRLIDGRIPASHLRGMLMEPAEHLVSEINRCFDYYREEGPENVKSITLFGAGSSLNGLAAFMSERLGVPVKLGDPLGGLGKHGSVLPDKRGISHNFDIAIGAALSADSINLLPAEIKNGTKILVKRGVVEAVLTAVIVILILLFAGVRMKIGNLDKRIAVAAMEMAGISAPYEEAEAKMLAQAVLEKEPYWEDVFIELGSLIPENVYLENIKMANDIITIKGIVSEQGGQQVISNLILNMEEGLFKAVKLVESKGLPEKKGIEFVIKCRVEYER